MGRARGVRARRVSGIVRSRDESRRGKVRVVSLCKWDERLLRGGDVRGRIVFRVLNDRSTGITIGEIDPWTWNLGNVLE